MGQDLFDFLALLDFDLAVRNELRAANIQIISSAVDEELHHTEWVRKGVISLRI